MIPASAILITKNEERNLARTLESVKDFREIVVVDADSSDRTREIAKGFGARVFTRSFDDFSAQKNFALNQATGEWIFSLDADEVPDEQLIQSIQAVLQNGAQTEAAYAVHRRNLHFGRELRWGGQGRDFPVRLFRKDRGRFTHPIHEVVEVDGKVGRLAGTLLHVSNQSVGEYLEKLSQYTGLEAQVLKQSGKKISFWDWGFKPFARFFYTYFLRLGFLDGFEGFLFHALSSFYLAIKYCRVSEGA